MPPPLTLSAHHALESILAPGDAVIDATAGNGHDTLFLAKQVGPSGRVYAFDVQQQALSTVRQRLEQAQMLPWVQLIQEGHENMTRHVRRDDKGQIKAVMFNLGYLPGSDKRITTTADNSLTALSHAVKLLAPGGIISVLAYRGHSGGQEETDAVAAFLRQQSGFKLKILDSPGPVLYLMHRNE